MHKSIITIALDDSLRGFKASYDPDDMRSSPEGGRELKTWFFKSFDPAIQVGDLCVVETSTRYGKTVVKIIEADVTPDFEADIDVKWILSLVDQESYKSMVEREKYLVAKVQQAQQAKKREQVRADLLGGLDAEAAELTMLGAPSVDMSKRPRTPKPSAPFPPAYAGLDDAEVVTPPDAPTPPKA
jgi:hypothetical protein